MASFGVGLDDAAPMPLLTKDTFHGFHPDRARTALPRPRASDFIETTSPPRNHEYHEQAARRAALEGDPGDRGAEAQGQGRRAVEPVHAARQRRVPVDEASSSKAPSSPTSRYALCAGKWGGCTGRVRVFNCSAPTPAIWKCSSAMAPAPEGSLAGSADERRDPLGVPDDRAGGLPHRTPPTSRPRSSAMATIT